MRLIWGESFSSSAMMSCKNMCIMKKGIDKCDYVGFSIFPKILVMCPSHFNPNRSSLNVPEHILAVHIFPLSILFLRAKQVVLKFERLARLAYLISRED